MTTEAVKKQTYTMDEFMALPEDGKRYELVKGALVEMAPAGGEQGEIGPNLVMFLGPYVRQNKLGRVFSNEAAFTIDPVNNIARAPDVAFVAAGRLPTGALVKGAIPFPPDLAVEIISPSDVLLEVEEKVAEYLEAGVKLIWVINPRRKVVYVYRAGSNQRETLQGNADLDGEMIVPGFKIKIAELFTPGY